MKHSPVSSNMAASPPPFRFRLCKLGKKIEKKEEEKEVEGKNLGTGVTGFLTGPIPSKNVYSTCKVRLLSYHDRIKFYSSSTLSVDMIVQLAPSLSISLFGSFGQGVA